MVLLGSRKGCQPTLLVCYRPVAGWCERKVPPQFCGGRRTSAQENCPPASRSASFFALRSRALSRIKQVLLLTCESSANLQHDSTPSHIPTAHQMLSRLYGEAPHPHGFQASAKQKLILATVDGQNPVPGSRQQRNRSHLPLPLKKKKEEKKTMISTCPPPQKKKCEERTNPHKASDFFFGSQSLRSARLFGGPGDGLELAPPRGHQHHEAVPRGLRRASERGAREGRGRREPAS